MTLGQAYYNEHDPYAVAWLRGLITAGAIAPGVVDERDIRDVLPSDLEGFTQCHFFAGIGGWSLALRLAGWPDDRPIWTGSCPCQPFSAAGKGDGFIDERHLWPDWYWLIAQCRPDVIAGEQVESAIRHGWIDLVSDDLEGLDYAIGAVALPAASVGAPHIRQRVWFVAESEGQQHDRRGDTRRGRRELANSGDAGELADSERRPTERRRHDVGGAAGSPESGAQERQRLRADVGAGEQFSDLAHAPSGGQRIDGGASGHPGHADERDPVEQLGESVGAGSQRLTGYGDDGHQPGRHDAEPGGSTTTTSAWDDLVWLPCRDGKARPTQSGIFPLVDGVSSGRVAVGRAVQHTKPPLSAEDAAHEFSRTGVLRGAGNAIVPACAATIIQVYMQLVDERKR